MTDMQTQVQNIYSLEQLSRKNTCIHRLHPAAKLLTAIAYIVIVVSFNQYALDRLIPYIFYPVIVMALAEIPYGMLLKRVAIALPFGLFAGISNLFFDRTVAFYLSGIAVSQGMLSFAVIIYRTFLCVIAVLILVSTTPFTELCSQLRRLHVPEMIVTIFEMTYRYIGALLLEASSMYTAYMLRTSRRKGLEMRHMGSFVGQLLLRSFDRAERVYGAMKCRGYRLKESYQSSRPLSWYDGLFLMITVGLCLLFRFVDVPALLTHWINGVL